MQGQAQTNTLTISGHQMAYELMEGINNTTEVIFTPQGHQGGGGESQGLQKSLREWCQGITTPGGQSPTYEQRGDQSVVRFANTPPQNVETYINQLRQQTTNATGRAAAAGSGRG